jgi:hypothetical protein
MQDQDDLPFADSEREAGEYLRRLESGTMGQNSDRNELGEITRLDLRD